MEETTAAGSKGQPLILALRFKPPAVSLWHPRALDVNQEPFWCLSWGRGGVEGVDCECKHTPGYQATWQLLPRLEGTLPLKNEDSSAWQ